MHGAIALKYAVGLVLMLTATAVGITMVMNLGDSGGQENDNSVITQVKEAPRPICTTYSFNEAVGPKDFKRLLYASYTGNCAEDVNTSVRLDFTLSNLTASQYVSDLGITDSDGDPVVLVRDNCDRSSSIDGVVYGNTESERIFYSSGTMVNISTSGTGVHVCS